MSAQLSHPQSFAEAARALELDMLDYLFDQHPAEQCGRLAERIKLTAKLLSRCTTLPQGKALDAVAQAIRFRHWHELSTHLTRGAETLHQTHPKVWRDALSAALVLMVVVEDEVSLSPARLSAFEQLGQTLAMLTDMPTQRVLDAVPARLCGGSTWLDVRKRSPLKAMAPLYTFVVPERHDDDDLGGYFEESPACLQLTEELDEQWQGYDAFSKVEKRRARKWVEDALASQPGFLEAGLALAWMQRNAGQTEAASTVHRYIRQAEALMPAGFKGPLTWSHLGNRFYHRMLWLQLKLQHEAGELDSAARAARKQLRLNPNDNLGVRYVLPQLLLEQGNATAARRDAVKHLRGEPDLTAAAIRAFCEHAVGNHAGFRMEMAAALVSLPWLRKFLLDQRGPLPEGDDGIRGIEPDLETFGDFAWPAYLAVTGLRKACEAFLAEPLVLQAEAELRRYWKGYWVDRDRSRTGSHEGWNALRADWTKRLAQASVSNAVVASSESR